MKKLVIAALAVLLGSAANAEMELNEFECRLVSDPQVSLHGEFLGDSELFISEGSLYAHDEVRGHFFNDVQFLRGVFRENRLSLIGVGDDGKSSVVGEVNELFKLRTSTNTTRDRYRPYRSQFYENGTPFLTDGTIHISEGQDVRTVQGDLSCVAEYTSGEELNCKDCNNQIFQNLYCRNVCGCSSVFCGGW
ncbi:MAG: hypothetical protein KDD25_06595 [Bdellovibrionales bacterium]|nr:hypothetical protein [Bdellovibrionales bacterium]